MLEPAQTADLTQAGSVQVGSVRADRNSGGGREEDCLVVLLHTPRASYQTAYLAQARRPELRGHLVCGVEVALELDLVTEPSVCR